MSRPPRESGTPHGRTLVVDNYDSFTYNLVHLVAELGSRPDVRRHRDFDVADILSDPPDRILISPGPGGPPDAGHSLDLLAAALGRIPILGVCLGHQCVAWHFGARVTRAPRAVHGKTASIRHDGRGVFRGIPDPFRVGRYHSLAVDPDDLPPELEVTARTEDGVVMGIRHRRLPVEGVQFHPESFLTEHGRRLIANFLEMT
ncbi:MAG: aminodeoxychorismate/anthranilate synthase component II [Planctomycetota bacterium]